MKLLSENLYVAATGPTEADYDGITGSDGTVYFETSPTKPSGEWCFEVINVVHDSLRYEPDDNEVTNVRENG